MKKKEKIKNNIIGWVATLLLGGLIAIGTLGASAYKKANAEEEQPQLTQPLKANYDDDNYSITLTADELNNNTYTYLANQINDNATSSDFENTYLMYNNIKYVYSYFDENVIDFQNDNGADFIDLILDDTNNNFGKFIYFDDNEDTQPFTNSVYFYNAEWLENHMYDNGSNSMGTGIINNIVSGLGLIGNLASEFLTGFSALFWNTTTGQLTNFALFSLVMLGVAICFAVIKLVLNIIKSNTGA